MSFGKSGVDRFNRKVEALPGPGDYEIPAVVGLIPSKNKKGSLPQAETRRNSLPRKDGELDATMVADPHRTLPHGDDSGCSNESFCYAMQEMAEEDQMNQSLNATQPLNCITPSKYHSAATGVPPSSHKKRACGCMMKHASGECMEGFLSPTHSSINKTVSQKKQRTGLPQVANHTAGTKLDAEGFAIPGPKSARLMDMTLTTGTRSVVVNIEANLNKLDEVVRKLLKDKDQLHSVLKNKQDSLKEIDHNLMEIKTQMDKAAGKKRKSLPPPSQQAPIQQVEEHSSLIDEYDETTEILAAHQRSLATFENDRMGLVTQIGSLNSSLASLSNQIEHLESKADSLQLAKNMLEEKLAASEAQSSQLEEQLQAFQAKYESLEQEFTASSEENQQKQQELRQEFESHTMETKQQHEATVSQMQGLIATLQTEKATLLERSESHMTHIVALETQIAALQANQQAKTLQIEQELKEREVMFQTRMDHLKVEARELLAQKQSVAAELSSKINALEGEKTALEQQKVAGEQASAARIESLTVQLQHLSQQVQQLELQATVKQSVLALSSSKQLELETSLMQLQQEKQALESQLQSSLSNASTDKASYEEKLSEAEEKIFRALIAQSQSNDEHDEKMTLAQSQTQSLKQEFEAERSQAQAKIAALQAEIQSLQTQLEAAKAQSQRDAEQMKLMQAQLEQYAQLQVEHATLNASAKQMEQQLAQVLAEVATLTSEKAELAAQLEAQQKESESQVNELNTQISELKSEILAKESQLSQSSLTNTKAVLGHQQQILQLKLQLSTLQHKYTTANNELQALRQSHQALSDDYQSMKTSHESLKAAHAQITQQQTESSLQVAVIKQLHRQEVVGLEKELSSTQKAHKSAQSKLVALQDEHNSLELETATMRKLVHAKDSELQVAISKAHRLAAEKSATEEHGMALQRTLNNMNAELLETRAREEALTSALQAGAQEQQHLLSILNMKMDDLQREYEASLDTAATLRRKQLEAAQAGGLPIESVEIHVAAPVVAPVAKKEKDEVASLRASKAALESQVRSLMEQLRLSEQSKMALGRTTATHARAHSSSSTSTPDAKEASFTAPPSPAFFTPTPSTPTPSMKDRSLIATTPHTPSEVQHINFRDENALSPLLRSATKKLAVPISPAQTRSPSRGTIIPQKLLNNASPRRVLAVRQL